MTPKIKAARAAVRCSMSVGAAGSIRSCGQVAQYFFFGNGPKLFLCIDCAEHVEQETHVHPPSLYLCGWCLKGCVTNSDGSAGCPSCEWHWPDPLTEAEASAFKATWDSFGPDKAKLGLDWPDRAEASWDAVEKVRGQG